MKILFITDGGLKDGMGHIYETIALAKELYDKADIYFLTRSEKTVIEKIKNNGFRVIKINNIKELINQLRIMNPNVVIIDLPLLDENLIRDIRQNLNTKTKLVVFGNVLANLPRNIGEYCDVVVNFNLGSGSFESKSFIDKDKATLYLQGPRYFVLRDEFYRYKKIYNTSGKPKRILLMFGGSDPSNLTLKVLDKLLSLDYNFDIDVVLGPCFRYYHKLNRVLERHQEKKRNVKIYFDVNNIAELMYNADLVITSPGLSMFEALCIGVPTIAICQNDLQRNAYRDFEFVYNIDCIDNIEKIIFKIYNSLPNIMKNIEKLEIGKGKKEIIDTILSLGGV
ncbi:MAG TPA: UDP-2,4-diacetamido-2,4,6-trideoxy-beta-L-altropyranose hydrolase [Archaeoglobus profundus]|nr:UDP-2,4-diacetamido-2,4,6-trideoxy-beta-L-altropyranose hydrolase [Archaeoglobus profundus]